MTFKKIIVVSLYFESQDRLRSNFSE